jgi:hypothetical protein
MVVIDVTEKVKKNSDYELSIEDLINWEKKFGEIPNNSFICMKTG